MDKYDIAIKYLESALVKDVPTSVGVFTFVDVKIPRKGNVVLVIQPSNDEVWSVVAHGERATTTGNGRATGRNALEAAADYLAAWIVP